MKKILLISLALAEIVSVSAAPQLPPVSFSTNDPIGAANQSISYSGECKNGKYEMRISMPEKRVEFFLGDARKLTDVTKTRFGQTFVTSPLAGTFTFACSGNTLYATFWGIDIPTSGPPKSVTYRFALQFDGSVDEDWGIRDIDQSQVVRMLTGQYIHRSLSDHQR